MSKPGAGSNRRKASSAFVAVRRLPAAVFALRYFRQGSSFRRCSHFVASVKFPITMAPVEKLATEAADASQGFVSRAQRFIEDNQKAILIGCGVAAAAGAGYYLYTQRGSGSSGPSSGSSGSAPASGSSKNKKKKKSKKSEKFLKGEGTDGPLLEEIKPKPAEKKVEEKVSDDPLDGKYTAC